MNNIFKYLRISINEIKLSLMLSCSLLIPGLPLELKAQKTPKTEKHHNFDKLNDRKASSDFNKVEIGTSSETSVKTHLLSKIENLKYPGAGLIFDPKIESLIGKHFTAYQTYKGVKIYNSQIKVNTDKSGKILSVFDNSYLLPSFPSEDFPTEYDYKRFTPLNEDTYKVEKVYFILDETIFPAISLTIFESVENHKEMIISREGKILFERDLNMYIGKDTVAVANVFTPDPLTTALKDYGIPYADSDDSDIPELNNQIIQVNIPVTFEDNLFKLENRYIKLTEHSAPSNPEVTSTSPEFLFTRSQDEFENINIFYHINIYQNYLQSIGFTNLVNYQIHADPHALGGSDQSSFSSSFNPPRMNFGDGGVDDAEDADVVLHEYGHAIMFSAAPFTNSGSERQALDEAIGDYIASSYSRTLNEFAWEKVFTWDGHNEFWAGRSCNSSKHYPENLTGGIHQKGEIWSSTIMQINNVIGQEATDKILFQSAYSYAANMSMPDAAKLFLQADSLLNNGANYITCLNFFVQRGILQDPLSVDDIETFSSKIELSNTENFAIGKSPAVINFQSPFSGTMHLYDATGKLVLSKLIKNAATESISSEKLAKGTYILNFQSETQNSSFKLMRL